MATKATKTATQPSDFDPPALEILFDAMRTTRRDKPSYVEITVEESLVTDKSIANAMTTVQLVPTMIRLVNIPGYPSPEYEFEGWLLGDYPERIWVHGLLGIDTPGVVTEGSIRRIAPGEEVGTHPGFPHLNPKTRKYEFLDARRSCSAPDARG